MATCRKRCPVQQLAFVAVLSCLLLSTAIVRADDPPTPEHTPGFCSMYGICGHRADGDVLNCPNSTLAQPLTADASKTLQELCPALVASAKGQFCCTGEQVEQLSRQIRIASIFLVGCPACNRNFHEFFCNLVCSPDQATFSNVTAVQQAHDNNATVVDTVDYFVADSYGAQFFNSCKDVVYPVLNQKAMKFVGGGAADFQEWFQFLGMVKDKRSPPTGSPFQMNFPGQAATPRGMAALNASAPTCAAGALRCSCGDCPDAPQCVPPPAPPPPPPPGCAALGLGGLPLACHDWALLLAGVALLASLPWIAAWLARRSSEPGDKAQPDDGYFEGEDHDMKHTSDDGALADEDFPYVERQLRRWFRRQGVWCARRPWLVLGLAAVLCGLAAGGLARLRVETDPQRLWVGPASRAARDKAAYEASFGPFYRIEQLILTTTLHSRSAFTSPSGLPAIVTDANIRLLFQMQAEVDALNATYLEPATNRTETARLTRVCYKPMGTACATQSLLQYWQMSQDSYAHGLPPYHTRLSPDFCFGHWSTQCRAAFGAPIDPRLVLGGFPDTAAALRNLTAAATSFIVTYPVDSSPANRAAALAWEAAFVELARGRLADMAASANLTLSFSTERSVQDELERESYADAGTVAVSYVAMLAYLALALGAWPRGGRPAAALVYSRGGLGLGGVALVAGAVAGALGLLAWAGLWATLIIMEVIPFLVLAVGVDNMFILAHALERQPAHLPLPHRMGAALAAAGPSITLAASAEALAFALGVLTPMPAIRNFSLCAALAVVIDYLLQVTAFVAMLALDTARLEAGRLDPAPCITLPASALPPSHPRRRQAELAEPLMEAAPGEVGTGPGRAPLSLSRALHWYMARVHAPALLRPRVQAAVLALFGSLLLLSLAAVPHVARGLDQAVALPRDSYLQDYFRDVLAQLRTGPPLFLVVRDLNLSTAAPDVNHLCSTAGCDDDSLLNQVAAAARQPAATYIASPAASWLDDFLSWISPDIPQCCRLRPGPPPQRCPPPDQPPCAGNASACAACTPCFTAAGPPGPSRLDGGRPTPEQWRAALPWFLEALPSPECAKGGAGAYTDAIQAGAPEEGGVAGLGQGVVAASAFRAYYVPLSRQEDFIRGMQAVYALVDRARQQLGLDVYPYSTFHIFFEQYLTIGRDTVRLLALAGAAIWVVCGVLTGSWWGAGLVLAVLASLLANLVGAMWLAGIQLNAVSLVNLAMSLGIGVEFCAHVLHAFLTTPGPRPARAAAALCSVGASVLTGITLTKFVGVAVLAFARTQIFETYFFRMYLALVFLGAAHGLLLLPVLLALAGPPPLAPGPPPDSPGPAEVAPRQPAAAGLPEVN